MRVTSSYWIYRIYSKYILDIHVFGLSRILFSYCCACTPRTPILYWWILHDVFWVYILCTLDSHTTLLPCFFLLLHTILRLYCTPYCTPYNTSHASSSSPTCTNHSVYASAPAEPSTKRLATIGPPHRPGHTIAAVRSYRPRHLPMKIPLSIPSDHPPASTRR